MTCPPPSPSPWGPCSWPRSIGLAWWLAGSHLALVLAIYVAVTTAYSVRLKHEPVVDLACVSTGFVLRAIAGGVATGVPLSDWFIIVSSFGSLLIVTGKRSAEQIELGELRGVHRPTLSAYPEAFLRSVRLLAAAVTVERLLPLGLRALRPKSAGATIPSGSSCRSCPS